MQSNTIQRVRESERNAQRVKQTFYIPNQEIACNQLLNVSRYAHYTRKKYQKAKKIHVKYVRDSILQFVAECA